MIKKYSEEKHKAVIEARKSGATIAKIASPRMILNAVSGLRGYKGLRRASLKRRFMKHGFAV